MPNCLRSFEKAIAFSSDDRPAPRPKAATISRVIAEDLVGLPEPLALLLADDVAGGNDDVLEQDLRRVGETESRA